MKLIYIAYMQMPMLYNLIGNMCKFMIVPVLVSVKEEVLILIKTLYHFRFCYSHTDYLWIMPIGILLLCSGVSMAGVHRGVMSAV